MLHRTFIGLILCTLVLTSHANADLTLTLSSPSNLSGLTVGQTFEIDVNLSGLPAGDFIFNLNSQVDFSSSLFTAVPDTSTSSGLTAVVAPGSVFFNSVQGPLQVANFQFLSAQAGGLSAGSAIGDFNESPDPSSGAIGLNGLYYSFLLKATSVGTGSILLDPTPGANEYADDTNSFGFQPFSSLGSPLAFTISPAAVPEPSSIVLCGISGLFVAAFTRRRSRARRQVSADRPT
jgi:hypothetical protein